jgi:hypothetical protein
MKRIAEPSPRRGENRPAPSVLAAIAGSYQQRGLGAPEVLRLDLPPRALTPHQATRWRRALERWFNPRDRVRG